jgi:hypothetical protein
MTQDYPDWTRLFRLVGTDITIPISIDAATVTLPVSIDAATIELNVNLISSATSLWVKILSSVVTLDVNIESQTANIDFNFADQSVAVFDAGKWFARQLQHIRITGTTTINDNSVAEVASYTVPAGKIAYIVGISYGLDSNDTPAVLSADMRFDSYHELYTSSYRGHAFILDVPIRHSAGYTHSLWIGNYGAGASIVGIGGFWGYLEDA